MNTKVAVVTGAAGGLGRAISQKLMDSGFGVVGLDIDVTGLDETTNELGTGFVPKTTDLTDAGRVKQVFEEVRQNYGGVDVLVNNAGTCFMSDFPNISSVEFDKQMATNFSSTFHCCQAAIPAMLERDGVKKIVNISSNGAYNFDVFDPPHYRASKAAMDTLTKDLARRYASERIAVNSIAPAMTETPLFGVLSKEVLQKAIGAMPHGRAMQASEIAAWVDFLVSPAGDVSSGNIIILNQGRDVR